MLPHLYRGRMWIESSSLLSMPHYSFVKIPVDDWWEEVDHGVVSWSCLVHWLEFHHVWMSLDSGRSLLFKLIFVFCYYYHLTSWYELLAWQWWYKRIMTLECITCMAIMSVSDVVKRWNLIVMLQRKVAFYPHCRHSTWLFNLHVYAIHNTFNEWVECFLNFETIIVI